MSKNEILKMPAGREMDALIERYIFHHEVFIKDVSRKTSNPNKRKENRITTQEPWVILTKYSSAPVRSFSTNISVAWEILEKYIKTSGSVFNPFVEKTPKGFACSLDGINYALECETAPLAICRAALLAVIDEAG